MQAVGAESPYRSPTFLVSSGGRSFVEVRDRRPPPEARRYIVGKMLQVFEANDREARQVVDQGRVSVGAEAEETGLSGQIVCKIKDAPAAADAALATSRGGAMSRWWETFASKQGQYLVFIHMYTRLHHRLPGRNRR
jgi:hypothetical protein